MRDISYNTRISINNPYHYNCNAPPSFVLTVKHRSQISLSRAFLLGVELAAFSLLHIAEIFDNVEHASFFRSIFFGLMVERVLSM